MDYKSVLAEFDKVKEHHSFDIKLAAAKAHNENVLVKVDDSFYVVDSSGWIKIDSDKGLVSIDDKSPYPLIS